VIAYRVTVDDYASPALERLERALSPTQLRPLIGRSARHTYVEHFRALNATRPNWLGGRRTNYYLGAARATHFDVVGDAVVISVNQVGIAQRYFGGTIRAGRSINPRTGRPTKFLTIPVHPQAHGRRAAEFPELEIVYGARGEPVALATPMNLGVSITQDKRGRIRKRNIGRRGEIMFRLVRSVVQQPDPSVLPAEFAVRAVLRRDLADYAEMLWRRRNLGAN
jgi:hypothetical protein